MNPQDPNNIDGRRSMDMLPDNQNFGQNDPRQKEAPLQSTVMAPADDIAQATQIPEAMIEKPKQSNRMSPKSKLAIIITFAVLLVVMLLIGLFIVQSNKKDDQSSSLETGQVPTSDRVSTGEIDQTITNIDNKLNTLNDSEDFKPDELKNGNIGL